MKNVDDVYPMSAMQEFMLVHLLSATKSDVLVEQICYLLHGELDVSALRRAWEQELQRHAMLRTCFMSEGLKRSLQVVRQKVSLPWEQQDWRALSGAERQGRLDSFLETDRERGFDPTRAPLMRFALVRCTERTYYFTWTIHHILVDRWSLAVILKEVFAFYEVFSRGQTPELDSPRPYRDYVSWLQQRDSSWTEAYWRKVLDGLTTPTRVIRERPSRKPSVQADEYRHQLLQLEAETTAALRSVARQYRVTLNNVAQAAWALLLSRWSGQNDVVFGITVSGRPADLEGVESMVGVFTNNLPMRATVTPDQSFQSWLRGLHEQQVEMHGYEYTPLALIQEWSNLPGGSLFDTLLVFQNVPTLNLLNPEAGSALEIQLLGGGPSETRYPVTVTMASDERLSLVITYDAGSFDSATIAVVRDCMRDLLHGIAENSCRNLGDFMRLLGDFSPASGTDWDGPAISDSEFPPSSGLDEYAAPSTPMQLTLAQVWQEVLEVDRVGLYDNFFDLGGTSLLAARSVVRLEKKTGVQLNPVELIPQTLAQIAAVCERQLDKKKPPLTVNATNRIGSFFKDLVLPGEDPAD